MTTNIIPAPATLSSKHLLGIEGMSVMTMHQLLDRASYFADHLTQDVEQTLKGSTIVNLFFENSTRTRVSFEVAAKKLGASVLNISVAGS